MLVSKKEAGECPVDAMMRGMDGSHLKRLSAIRK